MRCYFLLRSATSSVVWCWYLLSIGLILPIESVKPGNSWAINPVLERMSGRPRSCVTAPNQHNQGVPPYFSISATCYLSEYWFTMIVILLIIFTVVNRLSGEVLVGIYKRRCNREKTRTWALNQQCPMASACRFLQTKNYHAFINISISVSQKEKNFLFWGRGWRRWWPRTPQLLSEWSG